jgi:hypothetical protein
MEEKRKMSGGLDWTLEQNVVLLIMIVEEYCLFDKAIHKVG